MKLEISPCQFPAKSMASGTRAAVQTSLTKEEIARKAILMRSQGETLENLAKFFGVPRSTLHA